MESLIEFGKQGHKSVFIELSQYFMVLGEAWIAMRIQMSDSRDLFSAQLHEFERTLEHKQEIVAEKGLNYKGTNGAGLESYLTAIYNSAYIDGVRSTQRHRRYSTQTDESHLATLAAGDTRTIGTTNYMERHLIDGGRIPKGSLENYVTRLTGPLREAIAFYEEADDRGMTVRELCAERTNNPQAADAMERKAKVNHHRAKKTLKRLMLDEDYKPRIWKVDPGLSHKGASAGR